MDCRDTTPSCTRTSQKAPSSLANPYVRVLPSTAKTTAVLTRIILPHAQGNLRNLHSHKYSGLANTKTVDVRATASGVQLTTLKKGASPHAVRSARAESALRPRSGSRRAMGVGARLTKRGYRADLRQVRFPGPRSCSCSFELVLVELVGRRR